MSGRERSRLRGRSYEEITQYKIVSSPTAVPISRARSVSRGRTYEEEEHYHLTTTRDRSKSRPRPVENSRTCIPCSLVAPSSTLRKRLIVCCDGTFCAADKGKENNPTNIARLSRCIANVGLDERNIPILQIVDYQSGVGTGKLTALNKASQGAFGDGLTEKVCEAYTFLANNYGPGDEIFIFGFSRGAYTARSLASFICQVGLMSPGMMDYFSEIFNAYKNRNRRRGENDFRDMAWAHEYVRPGELGFDTRQKERITRYEWVRRWAHLHARVRVVGVYDTVGSIGMSGWVPQPGQDVDWHATRLHPKIDYAFHALSLDEHRGNFPPTMSYLDKACRDAGVKLRQCWFPGYHSCVGGESNPRYDVNSVDEITFAWMIDQLTHYNLLQINKRALKYPILDRLSMSLPPNGHDPPTPRNPQEAHERRIDWSDGKLVETQTLFWEVASHIATKRWEYRRKPGQYRTFDERTREELDYTGFRETIHPSVWHRIQYRNYEPYSLPLSQWSRHRLADGQGYEWMKASRSGLAQVRIPEYVIPDIPERSNGMEHWTGSLEARIAPTDYLRKLDQQNGISRGWSRPKSSRIDSGYATEYDENYLSPLGPTISKTGSRHGDGYDYSERETITIRTTSPRPPSRGEAADYFDPQARFG